MSESRGPVTEAVGRFETRAAFEDAVKALTEAGFGHADLSVLDSHESLDAAGKEGDAWRETLASLTGEVNFIGPIAAAGLIAIATGPVGAAVALAAGALDSRRDTGGPSQRDGHSGSGRCRGCASSRPPAVRSEAM